MGRNCDLLIVDDEKVICDLLMRFAGEDGASADAAEDAETAKHLLSENNYRVVISDLMLPRQSGFGLLEHIRLAFPGTPVILTTGCSKIENAVESLYSGAFDFLPKPFDIHEGLGLLDRVLRFESAGSFAGAEARWRDIPAAEVRGFSFLGIHSWASALPEGVFQVGAADGFYGMIEEISSVELPSVGDKFEQGAALARIFTASDHCHTIRAPVGGHVVSVNGCAKNNPELIVKDSFGDGWLCCIQALEPGRDLWRLKSR